MPFCTCLATPFVPRDHTLTRRVIVYHFWPPRHTLISMLVYTIPSISEVISRTEEYFGITPHLFQVEDTLAQPSIKFAVAFALLK